MQLNTGPLAGQSSGGDEKAKSGNGIWSGIIAQDFIRQEVAKKTNTNAIQSIRTVRLKYFLLSTKQR